MIVHVVARAYKKIIKLLLPAPVKKLPSSAFGRDRWNAVPDSTGLLCDLRGGSPRIGNDICDDKSVKTRDGRRRNASRSVVCSLVTVHDVNLQQRVRVGVTI